MNGSELLIKKLKENNTDTIFGYPGGMVIPLYDTLYDADIRHVLVRHEQAAAHAADGYARVSGKVGVCLATSGPGATNLITGIATAHMDSSPIIAITGQVNIPDIGNDAFQEVDTMGLTMPIVKHNFQLRNVEKLPEIIDEAYYISNTGRPGPIVIDIPKNIFTQEIDDKDITTKIKTPGYNPTHKGNPRQIKKVINEINQAKKPMIIAGGGVIISEASHELVEFAETTQIPVATTLMGKGSITEKHPLSLGLIGMHGIEETNTSIKEADLIIAIGCRFSDRSTGKKEDFAPNSIIIHIDIDPAEIGKNIPVDIPIVGDAKTVLHEINEKITVPTHSLWTEEVTQKRQSYQPKLNYNTIPLKPQQTLNEIMQATEYDTIITTDVGQNQMWMAHHYKTRKPRTFITSGGLGTMGFAIPASIGAQIAKPEKDVLCICGDGGFQMTSEELATIKEEELPITICILNNRLLGMVAQWQKLFYDNRLSETQLSNTPDFIKLADAYNIESTRIERPGELQETIIEARKSREPHIIDIPIDPEELLLPMVPPGGSITKMISEEEKKNE